MININESAAIEELVRARAYALWESEGRPNGRDADHWLRSMEEMQAQRVAARPAAEAPKTKTKAPAKGRAKKAVKTA